MPRFRRRDETLNEQLLRAADDSSDDSGGKAFLADDTPGSESPPDPVLEQSGEMPQNSPGAGLFEAEDLGVLVGELDAFMAQARSLPLLKAQIVLDRESVYNVVDRMRMAIPETIRAVRWFRQQHQLDADPPLREHSRASTDVLADIDALDDLIHHAPPIPLTDSVRVGRHRLGEILDRMRNALVPLARELAEDRRTYPETNRKPDESV